MDLAGNHSTETLIIIRRDWHQRFEAGAGVDGQDRIEDRACGISAASGVHADQARVWSCPRPPQRSTAGCAGMHRFTRFRRRAEVVSATRKRCPRDHHPVGKPVVPRLRKGREYDHRTGDTAIRVADDDPVVPSQRRTERGEYKIGVGTRRQIQTGPLPVEFQRQAARRCHAETHHLSRSLGHDQADRLTDNDRRRGPHRHAHPQTNCAGGSQISIHSDPVVCPLLRRKCDHTGG